MRRLFAKGNQEVLAQFAWSSGLVGLDFDGTLAPIVADPDRAEMRPSTRRLLDELAQRYPCVVISGRDRDDVASRLTGLPLAGIVGNHGLLPDAGVDRVERVIRRWGRSLAESLSGFQGVVVEVKRFSLAVHYRKSRTKRQARAAILAAVAQLGSCRLLGGKLVFNVLPEGAPHKGVALERLRALAGCDTALFVGDDVTDEDVFALDQPGRLLTVRVGRSQSSAAEFFLVDQREVDRLLAQLVALREIRRASRRLVP